MPNKINPSELINRKEDLHGDLVKYLSDSPGIGKILQHPLVYSVPHTDFLNALCNAQYKYKKDAVKNYRENQKWKQYVFMHEKPYRMQAFLDIADEINDHEEYWDILSEIFINTENMYQWKDMIYEAIEPEDYYRKECRYLMMSKRELYRLSRFPQVIKIYRGCFNENEMGWSWSIEKEIAKTFAFRWGKKGHFLTGTIDKKNIIAFFDRRGEEEIFVDPCLVDNIKDVDDIDDYESEETN